MTKRMWPAAAGAVAMVALLGGCGLGFGDEMIGASSATAGSTGIAVPMPPSATDQGSAVGASGGTAGPSTSTAPSSGDPAAAVTQVRDGIWDVGDGGQVDFAVNHGRLELMSSTPAGGWQQVPPVKAPKTIVVAFTQSPVTWTFNVTVTGGSMVITKSWSTTSATATSYPVGGAGSVSLTTSGSQLKLGAVSTESGWTSVRRTTDPTRISVSFTKGARTASFTADLTGGLVTTSEQMSGPVPSA